MKRRGNALLIVLGLALLLAVQVYIVTTFTSGSARQTTRLRTHLLAIAVGESAHGQLLARLLAAPWSERWFRDGPAAVANVPAAGGMYSALVETAAGVPGKQADFWIRAEFEDAAVLMFWRVSYVDDSLDLFARANTEFFTFLPSDGAVPTSGAANPLRPQIDALIAKRKANAGPALEFGRDLPNIPSLPGVISRLGIPTPGAPLDERPGLAGAPALPQPGYVQEVEPPPAAVPPNLPVPPAPPPSPPLPPPPPPPDQPADPAGVPPDVAAELIANPFPDKLLGAIENLLKARGIDPANPSSRHFDNTSTADARWDAAEAKPITSGYDSSMKAALTMLDELADGSDFFAGTEGAKEAVKALDAVAAYLKAAAAAYAAEKGIPPPDPKTFPVREERGSASPNETKYNTIFAGYVNWFGVKSGMGAGNVSVY